MTSDIANSVHGRGQGFYIGMGWNLTRGAVPLARWNLGVSLH